MASWISSSPCKDDISGHGAKQRSYTDSTRRRGATYLATRGPADEIVVAPQKPQETVENISLTVRSHHSNSFLHIRPYATEMYKSTTDRRGFLSKLRTATITGNVPMLSTHSFDSPSSTAYHLSSCDDTSSPTNAPVEDGQISFELCRGMTSPSKSDTRRNELVVSRNDLCAPSTETLLSLDSTPSTDATLFPTDNFIEDMNIVNPSTPNEMCRTPSDMSISSFTQGDSASGSSDDSSSSSTSCSSPNKTDDFEDWENMIDDTVSFLISGCRKPGEVAAPNIPETFNPTTNMSSFGCDEGELSISGDYDGLIARPCIFDDYCSQNDASCSHNSFVPSLDSIGLDTGSCESSGEKSSGIGHTDENTHTCTGGCELTDAHGIMVVVDGLPKLKAGNLYRIVKCLTCDTHNDPEFTAACLLTYRIFTDAQTLFSILRQQYLITKNNMVRLKVCGVLKQWLEKHYDDFSDFTLLTNIADFLATVTLDYPTSAAQLKKFVENKGGSRATVILRTPSPHLPRGAKGRGLEGFDSEEIARQLSLIEFEWFRQIQPTELLNKAWVNNKTDASNICAMINRSNAIPFWVATEIVQRDNLEERVAMLRKFISIANHCRALNNFNALMEILSGLNMTAIYRLKRTWGALPQKSLAIFQTLNQLMSPDANFKAYREILKKVTQPRVPYLGRYLTDLVFTEDATPLHLSSGLINFWKCKSISQIILDLVSHQKQPYMYSEVPEIQCYLQKSKGLTENALLKQSRKLEPKVQ